MRVKLLIFMATLAISMFSFQKLSAHGRGYEIFIPISKHIEEGDVEKLSQIFASTLQVTVMSSSGDYSRSQATQVLKTFFRNYTPQSFEIEHKAGRTNMKYALGTLSAGGELFMVTVFVGFNGSNYQIQHIKIERMK